MSSNNGNNKSILVSTSSSPYSLIPTKNSTFFSLVLALAGTGVIIIVSYFLLRRGPRRKQSGKINNNNNNKNSTPKYDLFGKGSLSIQRNVFPDRISCSTLEILFKRANSGEWVLGPSSTMDMFKKLVSQSDVYLITQVISDDEENHFTQLINKSGLIENGLNPYKVLFCSTTEGRRHMVRQLSTDLHIDTHPNVITELHKFITEIVYIHDDSSRKPGHEKMMHLPNVYVLDNFEKCFPPKFLAS